MRMKQKFLLTVICMFVLNLSIMQGQTNIKFETEKYYYTDKTIEGKKDYLKSVISWIDGVEKEWKYVKDNHIDLESYNDAYGLSSRKLYYNLKSVGLKNSVEVEQEINKYEKEIDSIQTIINTMLQSKINKKKYGEIEKMMTELKTKRSSFSYDRIRLDKFVDSLLYKRKQMQKLLTVVDGIKFMETIVELNVNECDDIAMLRILQDYPGGDTLYDKMCIYQDVERIKAMRRYDIIEEDKNGDSNNPLVKVVSDDYVSELTAASNYYDKDIDFDKIFPHKNPEEQMSFRMPVRYNILGDTVCIFSNLNREQGFSIADNGDEQILKLGIPKGNYVVSGYVFCHDNMDSIRTMYNIKELEEKRGLRDSYWLDWQVEYSTKDLKTDILHGEDIYIQYYLAAVKLSSLDTIDGYHYDCYIYPKRNDNIEGVYHYNFYCKIKDYFSGKKVQIYCTEKPGVYDIHSDIFYKSGDFIKSYNFYKSGDIIRDELTNEEFKLQDSVFTVKDVIVKNEGVYVVMEGSRTGSFGYYISEIKTEKLYPYSKPELCAYSRKEKGSHLVYGNIITMEYRKKIEAKEVAERQKNEALRQRDEQELLTKKQEYLRSVAEREKKHKQDIINKYGSETGNLINNGRIAIGMTKDMCREAWGRPMNSYRTRTSNKQQEIWHYNYKTRVYFLNGKIVRIDD